MCDVAEYKSCRTLLADWLNDDRFAIIIPRNKGNCARSQSGHCWILTRPVDCNPLLGLIQELLMYADQKAELKQKGTEDEEPISGIPEPHQLYHPDAPEVENIVRTAWSNARLVAE